jgi:hypothetical protein
MPRDRPARPRKESDGTWALRAGSIGGRAGGGERQRGRWTASQEEAVGRSPPPTRPRHSLPLCPRDTPAGASGAATPLRRGPARTRAGPTRGSRRPSRFLSASRKSVEVRKMVSIGSLASKSLSVRVIRMEKVSSSTTCLNLRPRQRGRIWSSAVGMISSDRLPSENTSMTPPTSGASMMPLKKLLSCSARRVSWPNPLAVPISRMRSALKPLTCPQPSQTSPPGFVPIMAPTSVMDTR